VVKNDLTRPTDATIKRLFARSGNRCAFPRCTIEIVQDQTLIGEICHIKASRPGGPRYDPDQTTAQRHGYDNLILLCGTHHTVIDNDEEAYTVERLLKMKTDHEQRAKPLPDDRTASGLQLLIDQSVNATNQSGGISAHTVNIYADQSSARFAKSSVPQPAPFEILLPKDGPARFRAIGDPIGIRDDPPFLTEGAEDDVFLTAGPAMWLRVMPPLHPGKTWTSYELRTALGPGVALQPFRWGSIYGCGGLYKLRAEDGVGTCSLLTPGARETSSVAFAFKTGELWAIDTSLLAAASADLLAVDIENLFTERLEQYGGFLTSLGLQPPYHWIAGITAIKGRRLQRPPPPGQFWIPGWPSPQCLTETIETAGEYDGGKSALDPFFKAIFDACGVAPPDHLST
jgi:hypothetical protein